MDQAFSMWQAAAKAGDPSAMTNLGSLYLLGEAVPKDPIRARDWLGKAAELQNATAMFNLGRIYRDGNGVPVDPVAAVMWFDLAARRGTGEISAQAARARDQVSSGLTPAQLEDGRMRSSSWRPRPAPAEGRVRAPVLRVGNASVTRTSTVSGGKVLSGGSAVLE